MRNLNFRISGFFSIIIIIFTVFGCASEPVKVDLPVNHPANPLAQESAFIPPPNPFQNNIPMAEHETSGSPSMTHKEHQQTNQHQMMHQMEQMGKDPDSSPESVEENHDHQHKEHNQ
ncbi:MAG: hypothetical protein JSV31_19420 [Desulfobacterales bacterium]|nr:MAG: hypothetical protein JSV31_19420 [Desulfobacterales bacterium]